MMKIFSREENGFTLIEMIVALAIFSIVATVALGALMKIISANKKAQTLQSAMTNLNFALESMSREMRVGNNYSCKGSAEYAFGSGPRPTAETDCTNGIAQDTNGVSIGFNSTRVDPDGPCHLITVYSLKSTGSTDLAWTLEKAEQTECDVAIEPDGQNGFSSIVDPNVVITGYYIKVTKATLIKPYPLALIRLSGYTGARERERTYFDVQTAVSARIASDVE